LPKQKSKRTRRAYKLDVQHFMRTINMRSYDKLRQIDHRAVIAWECIMREIDGAAPMWRRTPSPKWSGLLLTREEGSTLAFLKADARRLLDNPEEATLGGLRNRAILAVGLQVGLRRAEIAALKAGDLHQKRGVIR